MIIKMATSVGENTDRDGIQNDIPSTSAIDPDSDTEYDSRKPTSELMSAIQLGIGQSVGGLSSKPERDVLMQDFGVVESVFFPHEGSNLTPAHHCSDFRFKTYAPVAFRYFRELFGIQADDFLVSLCDEPLKELSNPGASGSIFYLTADDEFIIKTVQHKEADFLQKLLPGYYMNLNQNPRTLLPKFYGLYCYQCGGKNIRFVVMNNLLPSSVKLHEKYDLKGSTYKRKASKSERAKPGPTYKDLDFMEHHPEGILLEKDKYDALMKTVSRDCRRIQISVHQKKHPEPAPEMMTSLPPDGLAESYPGASKYQKAKGGTGLARTKSMKTRLAQFSTPIESIHARNVNDETEEDEDIPPGGIPARNSKGERLLLYMGVIDILQSFRLKKKIEHTMKSIVIDGDTISVHRPSYYSNRFQDFFAKTVFRKLQTLSVLYFVALKHSPSKKKPVGMRKPNALSESEGQDSGKRQSSERSGRTISFSEDVVPGTMGDRPDLLPENSTPPPTFSEAIASSSHPLESHSSRSEVMYVRSHKSKSPSPEGGEIKRYDYQVSSTFQSVAQDSSGVVPYLPSIQGSPPLSISGSTPTHTEHTEGTPSYTASSPSCYSENDPAELPIDREEGPFGAGTPSPSKSRTDITSSTETSYTSAVENFETNGVGPNSMVINRNVKSSPVKEVTGQSSNVTQGQMDLNSEKPSEQRNSVNNEEEQTKTEIVSIHGNRNS
ncbi:hypothetical protein KUTeg_010953 [Tegillarca granosa]|uniref:PIPK domain-containing protein n=1 Tax=Tegillarca granosa TaxID=220873 RepID=A0ABQ9F2G9_TEGGR|nr:hypothetical protein KUTeg_010953 [Tegillarca granosa]